MRHNLRIIAAAVLAVAVTLLVIAVVATDASATEMPHTLYYITAGADGVQQVFRQTLDGRGIQEQITSAETDVLTYGLSERSEEIAYISGGELWLQTIGADDAQSIAAIEDDWNLGQPVFGVNDRYIAYADEGVWMIDRTAGETTQIVMDVPENTLVDGNDTFHIYAPEAFVADAGGTNVKLVMDLTVSEQNSSAVYDFEGGALTDLVDLPGRNLLPLSTGGALLYGNTGVAGVPVLYFAPDLSNPGDYTELVDFGSLSEHKLYASQALELALGHVRVFGWTGLNVSDSIEAFYFDVDVTTGETSEVQLITVSDDLPDGGHIGPLSPDGLMVVYYENEGWKRTGAVYGHPVLIDLMTGDEFEAPLPDTISMAQWR